MHPTAYAHALKKQTLRFEEKIQESAEVYSFIFKPETTCTWKAGQHAIFTLPDKTITGKKWRPFSVASAPYEGVIRIGTNVPEPHSDFKQKLLTLTPGEKIHMNGPFGEFYVRPHTKHLIGIAGGIGITPFRSVIADLTHKQSDIHITLIYSATHDYTYETELNVWQHQNKNLNIIYTRTSDEVTAATNALIATHHNKADYFISGSPGMIKAVRKNLKTKGIKKIFNDPFKGY